MKLKEKILNNFNIFIIIVCLVCILGMTVGYAYLNSLLEISGTATAQVGGNIEITRFELVGYSNFDADNSTATVNSSLDTINFDLKFKKDDTVSTNYYAVYEIDVENNSFFDYTFNAINFTLNDIVSSSGGSATASAEFSGISDGDVIQKGSMVTITIKFTLNDVSDESQEYGVSGSGTMDADDNPITNETFAVAVNTSSISFRSSTSAKTVSYSVISTYDNSISCTPRISNSAFTVPSNAITVAANEEGTTTYTTSVSLNGSPRFYADSVSLKITLDCDSIGSISSTNSFTALVDKYEEQDEQAPTISSVTVSKGSTEGNVNVSVSGTDNSNGNITYTITLYNSSGTQLDTGTVTGSSGESVSKTFTVSQGTSSVTYYATVTAKDTSNNTSAAVTSESVAIKWRATVTNNLTNTSSSNSASNVLIGSSYTATLNPSNNYTLTEDSVNVTMNGTSIISSGSVVSGVSGVTYNGSSSSGTITINSVTGDIVIEASSSSGCLIEGTLITLADGSKKKIEDIGYDDLLKVWDASRGEYSYAYPVYLEEATTVDSYLKITLSDGTILKVVGYHSVFDADNLKYVDVSNSYDVHIVQINDNEEFHVGTNILKDNGNVLDVVTVTNIESVNEITKCYMIVTASYYNFFANDILNATGETFLLNIWGYDEDYKFLLDRDSLISDYKNYLSYDLLSSYLDYYMYKGLRVSDIGYLFNNSNILEDDIPLIMSDFINLFNSKLLLPNTVNGKRVWMVTTSDDIVTEENKSDYLYEEGSYYTLKEPINKDNFIGWYNHADGNLYNVGDQVEIILGTYLEAIYEEGSEVDGTEEE